MDGPDRREEILGRRVLEQEPGGAGAETVDDVLLRVERREDDDPGRSTECAGRRDPVQHGHLHVHEDHIDGLRGIAIQRLPAIDRLPVHGHVGLRTDDHGHAGGEQLLVIGEAHGDHVGTIPAPGRPSCDPGDEIVRAPGEPATIGLELRCWFFPLRREVARGNPVRVRDCPAAVSGNNLRQMHWDDHPGSDGH